MRGKKGKTSRVRKEGRGRERREKIKKRSGKIMKKLKIK